MTTKDAVQIAGTLSNPSKMPGYAYGLPAEKCITGSKLAKVQGSVCASCYALKGMYKRFSRVVKPAQFKRLKSLKDPQWVDAIVQLIGSKKCTFFRWHDSGDIQSVSHLSKISEVASMLPLVKFWLPTRERSIVKAYLKAHGPFPSNLIVRISAHMVDTLPSTDLTGQGSAVHSTKPAKEAFSCPARKQNNYCLDCRMCWTRQPLVSYPLH